MNKIKRKVKAIQSISKEVAQEISEDLEPEEYLQFVANTILTDEAAKQLLYIIENTKARPFDLHELVDWLEMPLEHKREPREFTKELPYPSSENPSVLQFQYYKQDAEYLMNHVMSMWTDDWPYACNVFRYKMADPNKVLIFIGVYAVDSVPSNSAFFAKLDRSNNRIECCGDLEIYITQKFAGDFNKAMTFLCEEDGSRKYIVWGERFLGDYHSVRVNENLQPERGQEPYKISVAENIKFRK